MSKQLPTIIENCAMCPYLGTVFAQGMDQESCWCKLDPHKHQIHPYNKSYQVSSMCPLPNAEE